jgi:hypothetical protein
MMNQDYPYPSKIAQALADEDFRTIHDWLEDLKSCASRAT